MSGRIRETVVILMVARGVEMSRRSEDLPMKRRRGNENRRTIRSFWTRHHDERVDAEGGATVGELLWEMYSAKPCEVGKAKGLEHDIRFL